MLTFNGAGQGSLFAPDTWCGKTSPEPSHPTAERTSGRSSRRRSGSRNRTLPTFHYLPKGGGHWLTAGTEMGGPLPTEYSMHSFGECPSAAVESRLSQILEDTPPRKYYLSAKACAGILRRAKHRGKELPPELKSALEMQSQSEKEPDERGGGKGPLIQVERSGTLLIYDARGNGDRKTVCTITGDHEGRVTDYTAIVMRKKNFGEYEKGIGTLTAGAGHGYTEHLAVDGLVRCLTPLECERVQGYPAGWTDIGPWVDSTGKRHKESRDTARYKALGNSIALPPWAWVLKRLCACYERPATMASLFDGIGGFPLLWERLNGWGSCLWASEIEEFPMAVTRRHFGEEVNCNR